VVTQPTNLVVSSAGEYQTATVNVDASHTVTFDAGIDNPAFGGLTGSGSLALADAVGGAVTLQVGGNGPGSEFSGTLTGSGGLTKVGTNTFALASPNNTYLGDTLVSNGTLKLPSYALTPGLWEGLVISGVASDAPNYHLDATDPIPQTGALLAARMADTDQNWTNGTTWGYTGYFNNPASTDVEFTFGKDFDDGGLIKIDGTELIIDTSWGAFVTAKHTLSPGWHTLELRVGQGDGGVGPNGMMKDNGASIGLGWSTDGGTTWHGFSDPGDGTVLATELGGNNILPAGTTLRINSPGILDLAGSNTVNKLYLGGSGQAAGTYGSNDSNATNKSGYFSGSGVLTVTSSASGGTTYAGWAGVNAPGETATDDYDHDGVSNGLEYVLGGNKNTNDLDKLPKISADGTKFTFTLPASSASTATALRVEFSTDLSDWTTHAGTDIAPGVSGPVEVTIPLLGAHTFARLKVTLN